MATALLACIGVPLPHASPVADLGPMNFTFTESVKSGVTSKGMVFFIGADKTGTTTLKQLYEEMPHDWDPCHNKCHGKKWYEQSTSHAKEWFEKHDSRAFMDNGDEADFEWLAEHWEGARFVLNQRGLYDWLLSRFDMIVDNRQKGGCSYQGDCNSCKTGRNIDGSHTDMVCNDDESMKKEIKKIAKSQSEIKEYFKKTEGRKNRFIAIDLCGAKTSSTLTRLMWISRTELSDYKVSELMTTGTEFSSETRKHYQKLAEESALSLTYKNSNEHAEESQKIIKKFLEKIGCYKNHKDDLWYGDCADKIN